MIDPEITKMRKVCIKAKIEKILKDAMNTSERISEEMDILSNDLDSEHKEVRKSLHNDYKFIWEASYDFERLSMRLNEWLKDEGNGNQAM